MLNFLPRFTLVASLALPAITALSTISVKGAKFFCDGQQFFVKGVAYQGTPFDPLVDTSQCTVDAASMASLGTNSIRVYHVDPNANHDGCMSAFEEMGIYVWLDLDTFTTAIVQTDPTWEQYQFGNFTAVMDAFIKYDNLAGFWVGNEVINTAAGSVAAPYVKAATADMKSYMAAKDYRTVPIGYSAADIAELRPELQNYLACGSDYSQSIDFYGLNAYEWCGSDATYQTSGYSALQALSVGYSIPIFFSETGCNVVRPRTFADQAAIFGPDMINTWSGSIIYEWVEESNDYGLVNYPDGKIYNGAPIPIQPDYGNLASVWKNVNPSGVAEDSYSPSLSAPACPISSNGWAINGDVPLPTLASGIVHAEAASSAKPTSSTSSYTTPAMATSRTILTSPSSSSFISTSSDMHEDSSSLASSSPSHATDGSGSTPQGKSTREFSDKGAFQVCRSFPPALLPQVHGDNDHLYNAMSTGWVSLLIVTLIIPTDRETVTSGSFYIADFVFKSFVITNDK
ncbi:1,3-beta-glucanosyltransferase gas2 [Hyphodiscus hymeniophilus]|uniref:1,3-beta-glucanosyltransferase n=1 Tax=Hyphodiscus hymeniophilus TaxID=353542 RepID=A0A9P7AYG0_9HELO|nr:1,3-beta-glucanosyltransferase gas2 [Hyphodiscus hymeniophilus]